MSPLAAVQRASTDARTLPHNLEAERSVLGAVLIENSAFTVAASVIGPGDFFRSVHGKVFARIADIAGRDEPVDLVTLKDELERHGELEDVGGPAYIASLVDGVPRSTNVEYYARIVRDKSELRKLIAIADKTIEAAYADRMPAGEIQELLVGQLAGRPRDLVEAVSALDFIAAAAPVEIIAGIAAEDCITVVVAESSVGKTFVLLSAAAATSAGHSWFGRDVVRGSVVHCAFESDSLTARFRALHELKGFSLEHVYVLRPRDPITPQLTRDGELPSRGERILGGALRHLEARLAAAGQPPIRLLIIDTVRSSHSGSEDRSEDVAAYVRAVRRLLPKGAAAILAHHSGWQDGDNKRKRERGSSSWRGQVEYTLYLEAGDYEPATGETPLTLTTAKFRDGEKPAPLALVRRRVELPRGPGDHKPLTSCLIERDQRTPRDRDEERRQAGAVTDTVNDLRLLRVLIAQPTLTSQDQIRVALGVRKTVVTDSIARLIGQRGWLAPPEGRGKSYKVTSAGLTAVEEAGS